MKHIVRLLAVTLTALLMTTPALAEGELNVHDPWVREAPPTALVSAAYLSLENAGAMQRRLTGVASPAFGRVEMHRTEQHGGMAMMMRQESLELAPGSWTLFEPGGLHLMLIDRKHPLKAGDMVPLTLTFANGQELTFHATVRKVATMGGMDHSGHTMGGMDHGSPMGGMDHGSHTMGGAQ